MVSNFGTLGKALITGSVIHMAPMMLKGAMKEYLWQVSIDDFVKWVKSDINLWNQIDIQHQTTFSEFGSKLGPLDWLTVEWVMESGRPINPALYSMIESWPKAKEWLVCQVEDIKGHLGGINGRTDSEIPVEE